MHKEREVAIFYNVRLTVTLIEVLIRNNNIAGIGKMEMVCIDAGIYTQ